MSIGLLEPRPAVATTERRPVWSWAILTHVPLWGVTWTLVELSPALGPAFGSYVFMHFCVALLFARLADVLAAMWELAFREPPRFVTSGWLAAFELTVVPLFVAAFAIWWAA